MGWSRRGVRERQGACARTQVRVPLQGAHACLACGAQLDLVLRLRTFAVQGASGTARTRPATIHS
eukprot:2760119-Pyramimonas_sp.AAC.1